MVSGCGHYFVGTETQTISVRILSDTRSKRRRPGTPPPVLLFFTAFIAFSVRCVFDWPFNCSLAQLELSGGSTPDPPPPPVVIWVLQTWRPRVSALLGLFWNHHFCGCNPMENVVSRLQEGSLWVSKCWCSWNSMCSCVLGCMLACWAPFCNDEHFSFHCRTARHIPEQRPCAIADSWPLPSPFPRSV